MTCGRLSGWRAAAAGFIVITPLLLGPTPATAQAPETPATPATETPADARADGQDAADSFDAHLTTALEHYEARRYLEAVAEFRAAFAQQPEPDLQYNIARSLERGLQTEAAIEAYGVFLEMHGTTSEMRGRALTARSSLRAELEASALPAPTAGPPTSPAAPSTPSLSTGSSSAAEVEGSSLVPVGWTLVVVGATTLATGAVFGGLAIASNNDFDDATVRADQVRLRDEVRQRALLSDVLIGVGLAIGVTGAIFVVLGGGRDVPGEQGSVRVVPYAGVDGAGAALSSTF